MNQSIYPTSIKDIEAQLQAIWEKHRESGASRASLFTLVILAKHDRRESYLLKIVKNLIKRFPCRILVVTERVDKKQNVLTASVADIQTDNSIYCEQINFEVSENFRERIPYVIGPHILSDLPVYLLWGENPLEKDPLSLKLENIAARTIFDSETATHMVGFAKRVLEMRADAKCDIADLNWARFEDWRELFASTFNSEATLECLKASSQMTIEYNQRKSHSICHTKIQATYLQAWLATNLGWTFASQKSTEDTLQFFYTHPNGQIEITLKPGLHENLAPGRILSIEIITCDQATYHMKRRFDRPHMVEITHSRTDKCFMPTYHLLDQEHSGQSLIREIYHQETNSHFLKALELISQYQEGAICP